MSNQSLEKTHIAYFSFAQFLDLKVVHRIKDYTVISKYPRQDYLRI